MMRLRTLVYYILLFEPVLKNAKLKTYIKAEDDEELE